METEQTTAVAFLRPPPITRRSPVLWFQTSRTSPPRSRKSCLMRCWTAMYKKVAHPVVIATDNLRSWGLGHQIPGDTDNGEALQRERVLYQDGCQTLPVLCYLCFPSCSTGRLFVLHCVYYLFVVWRYLLILVPTTFQRRPRSPSLYLTSLRQE